MWKTFFLSLPLLLVTYWSTAQCYQNLRAEGLRFERQGNYEEAINHYLGALNCPDRPSSDDDDVPAFIKAALQARFDQLNDALAQVEDSRELADSARRTAVVEKNAAQAAREQAENRLTAFRLKEATEDLGSQDPNLAIRLLELAREYEENDLIERALADLYFNGGFSKIIPSTSKGSSIKAVTFSPDGRQVLTGSTDRTVRLWRIHTYEDFLHSDDLLPLQDLLQYIDPNEGPYRPLLEVWDILYPTPEE